MSELYVIEPQENQKWIITQTIYTDNGKLLCFLNNNQFIYQPQQQGYLEIFKFQPETNSFIKADIILLSSYFNKNEFFSSYHINQEKSILILRCDQQVFFYKLQENGLTLQHLIEFEGGKDQSTAFEKFSDNGDYLASWDAEQLKIQITKFRNLY